ncbi:motility protein B [Siminovitchia terrae]|uniref:Flagellar motor protein MotB n=1 Tax=Siminovitchia terrae TaxID=1914933 RepID=A0A429X3X7_SIMTE|nr:flagellar motor protein MotB [Siminovitchia terrae]RST57993.1 flagellar motor protein MotB [Siminovitchia terrae]GIN92198.1 motility protein B [Siminovitchia terrae]GIN98178.1 motility protein B [Siminovitchia terrae]
MPKRKRKKRHEEELGESWLLPYADLMTLLLALFIVLFAASSVDAQKFQQISKVFSGIFVGGDGPVEFEKPLEIEEQIDETEDDSQNDPKEQFTDELADLKILEALKKKVDNYIQEKKYEDKFSTSLTSEGLLITINDSVLFQSGSAEVRKNDKKTAKELAALLEMELPRSVIISGHTDNVPIKNSEFQSNWELSVMRAVNFMKVLLEDEKLDPRLFSAKGFGEFQPIADNKTAKGREANRRVEVLIEPYIPDEEK